MPEGHTIHGLARAMSELSGQRLTASSPQGRFDPAPVDGARLRSPDAFGKHLLLDFDSAPTVHVHLGMRGKWLRFAPVTGPGLPQVRLRLAAPTLAWDLIAPSRCELLNPDQRAALVGGLGPDPLRSDADPAVAYARVTAFPGAIGPALMDQTRIAGVGNVFRAEALHAARIAPTRPAAAVSADEFDGLWSILTEMMNQAVVDGRIVTVDADDRAAVPEADSRRVYKQARCYDCGTAVTVEELAGRTSYVCPRCQPG